MAARLDSNVRRLNHMPAQYPFVPRSTTYLVPGQYWSIPLSNVLFACGRVLQLRDGNSRNFIAGLMDWSGEEPPSAATIRGCKLIAHGQVHVKTIHENDGEILGCLSLEESGIEVPLSLDEAPGADCHLRRGFDVLRIASVQEQRELSVFSTWGYGAIRIRAEQAFGSGA